MQVGAKGANVQELQQQPAAAGFDPGPADALFIDDIGRTKNTLTLVMGTVKDIQ